MINAAVSPVVRVFMIELLFGGKACVVTLIGLGVF
jgi:hypothetical protein